MHTTVLCIHLPKTDVCQKYASAFFVFPYSRKRKSFFLLGLRCIHRGKLSSFLLLFLREFPTVIPGIFSKSRILQRYIQIYFRSNCYKLVSCGPGKNKEKNSFEIYLSISKPQRKEGNGFLAAFPPPPSLEDFKLLPLLCINFKILSSSSF